MKNPYKILSSKIVHKNPYWYVRDNIVIRPNKTKGHYYVIHKKDGIVIIPLTADKKYTYLVRQWRFAVSENAWEFPMGGLEDDETIFAAAQRELRLYRLQLYLLLAQKISGRQNRQSGRFDVRRQRG